MRPDELFSIFRPYFIPRDKFDYPQYELVEEFIFWLLALLLLLVLLRWRPSFLHKCENYGKRLSRNRGLVVAMVFIAPLAIRAALLLVLPIPDPIVHDEYSYILQAQTFASGRLTNPTPAGWEHFETFHVNMQPTYQSMYPPGQALFLTAAAALHSHPWWGVWLSVGVMCAAVCWMLQGWMPPEWALLGGLFCIIRFSTFSYWINSYWGGAVAAAGGALVLGSLGRLRKTAKVRYGLIFALGLALLANTRVYEGFIFSIPALAALAFWFFPAWKRGKVTLAILAPAASLLVIIGAVMGYYNWRSTGSPVRMPYAVNQTEYHITKPFFWQTRYPIPDYRHEVMRTFYINHEIPDYVSRRNQGDLMDKMRMKIEIYYDFFVWPMMILLIFATWATVKSAKMRIFPVTLVLMLVGLLIEQWHPLPHYAAPVLGVVIVVILYGLRLLWTWRPRNLELGPALVRSAVILLFVQSLLATAGFIFNPYRLSDKDHLIPQLERPRIMAQLEKIPGNHIIFVHLNPAEGGAIFWIYNDPDIAHSRIIWAHDMGNAKNQELLRVYPNRHVWFVDKDDAVNRVIPYPGLNKSTDLLQAKFFLDPATATKLQP